MWDKRRYATHVVSNLTFDPDVLGDWVRRMRARGITMPLLLGLPGPVDRTKLLGMATKIGVGESTRFLAKHKGLFARLAAPGGFTGERFLEKCAPALAGAGDAGRGAARLHVQPGRRDRGLADASDSSGSRRLAGLRLSALRTEPGSLERALRGRPGRRSRRR